MAAPEVPSDLLPHVYSYLVQNNLHKAAASLKKECGTVSRVLRGYRSYNVNVNCVYSEPADFEGTWTVGVLPALQKKVCG